MSRSRLTIWEHAQSQGYTRRDFIHFCTWMAAAAGIEASAVGRVVHALETKPRLPVVWFHFQECTCCSESFIRSSHPIVADIVLDKISLDYTETLQAAAGHQAEEALHETMKKYNGEYLMLVEGSVPTEAGRRLLLHRRPHGARHRAGSGRAAPRRSSRGAVAHRTAASRPPSPIPPAPRRSTRSSAASRSSTCRAARRSRDVMAGDDRAAAHLRHDPAARSPRPAEGVLRTPRARHVLSPPELRRRALRRVVGRRERAARATASTRWAAAARSPTTPAA